MSKRFSGRTEIWYNERKNVLVLRESKYLFEALYLDDINFLNWKKHAFKESFNFEFFNGSKYLEKNNFKLIERI